MKSLSVFILLPRFVSALLPQDRGVPVSSYHPSAAPDPSRLPICHHPPLCSHVLVLHHFAGTAVGNHPALLWIADWSWNYILQQETQLYVSDWIILLFSPHSHWWVIQSHPTKTVPWGHITLITSEPKFSQLWFLLPLPALPSKVA